MAESDQRDLRHHTGGAVIVTGASRGIGASIAVHLARRGVPVCINHANSPADAELVRSQVQALGGRVHVIRADLEKEEEIVRMFGECEDTLGPLYGLVNNAGYVGRAKRRIESADAQVLRKTFAINVIAPMLCTREAIARLSQRNGHSGGRIINISSIGARLGSAGEWVDYAASKAALNAFTLGAARELASEGIRVNAVSPGVVETRLHSDAGAGDRLGRLAGMVPVGRAAQPAEIAKTVEWLLLDAPDYITGSVFEIAGGL